MVRLLFVISIIVIFIACKKQPDVPIPNISIPTLCTCCDTNLNITDSSQLDSLNNIKYYSDYEVIDNTIINDELTFIVNKKFLDCSLLHSLKIILTDTCPILISHEAYLRCQFTQLDTLHFNNFNVQNYDKDSLIIAQSGDLYFWINF